MRIPKYLAILNASMIDGLYLPFSREPMVCLDTCKAAASSSCLIFLCFLSSSSLFFKCFLRSARHMQSPFYVKYTFHMAII